MTPSVSSSFFEPLPFFPDQEEKVFSGPKSSPKKRCFSCCKDYSVPIDPIDKHVITIANNGETILSCGTIAQDLLNFHQPSNRRQPEEEAPNFRSFFGFDFFSLPQPSDKDTMKALENRVVSLCRLYPRETLTPIPVSLKRISKRTVVIEEITFERLYRAFLKSRFSLIPLEICPVTHKIQFVEPGAEELFDKFKQTSLLNPTC